MFTGSHQRNEPTLGHAIRFRISHPLTCEMHLAMWRFSLRRPRIQAVWDVTLCGWVVSGNSKERNQPQDCLTLENKGSTNLRNIGNYTASYSRNLVPPATSTPESHISQYCSSHLLIFSVHIGNWKVKKI